MSRTPDAPSRRRRPPPEVRENGPRGAALRPFARRVGKGVGRFYQVTAINIVLNVLAVLLGFHLASEWQARIDRLRDIRNELSVLRPMQREVATLHRVAAAGAESGSCRTTGFDTSVWRSIVTTERALWIDDAVYAQISEVYRDLSATVHAAASGRMGEDGCAEVFEERTPQLKRLLDDITARKSTLEAEHGTLLESRQRGLGAFIRETLGWRSVAVLLFPAAAYGLLVAVVRFLR
jgi:hypothetical protein